MEEKRVKRKRISKEVRKFKRGDIVKVRIAGFSSTPHICIILDDYIEGGHVPCLPVCNFTGTHKGENLIDVSEFNLPNDWFESIKPNTWIRCNETACIYETNVLKHCGNIKDDYPKLWEKVCNASYSCTHSARLQNVCDCDFQIMDKKIALNLIQPPACNCEQSIPLTSVVINKIT